MNRNARRLISVVTGFLFPRQCAGCQGAVARGWWCPECRQKLVPIREPRCECCSHPFEGVLSGKFLCPNCEGRTFHFESAVAVMSSRGVVRELIHGLKYHSMAWAARPLGEMGFNGLCDPRLGDVPDVLVPVPLHPLRRRERGYNQSQLLAREMGRRSRIPVAGLLRRVRNTPTQTHFDRARRMKNLKRAFVVASGMGERVRGANVLLVDDVVTTGSTFDECARTLLEAGADRVSALAIGRG